MCTTKCALRRFGPASLIRGSAMHYNQREHGARIPTRSGSFSTMSTAPDKTPTVIGIAVVEHAGAYLVGRRPINVPLAGLAEFPGGKCRPDESPRDCAVRECAEETGLAVVPVQLLLRVPFAYPHGAVDLHFWLCRPRDAGDVALEHQGYQWVKREVLAQHPFPEANKSVIALLTAAR